MLYVLCNNTTNYLLPYYIVGSNVIRIGCLKYIIINLRVRQYKHLRYSTRQMNLNQEYTTPQIQYDGQGYVKSFDLDTASLQQLTKFYHRYGFLIFSNILAQEQIQKTIDDLWNSTTQYYKQMRNKTIDRNNPSTWGELRGFQKAYGFVGDTILQQPQIWENRKNPKVYKSFQRGYEAYLNKPLTEPLICNFDRGSLMLPSKNNQDWRSQDIYHFDIDPWSWTGVKENRHTKFDYNPGMLMMMLGEGNYDPFVGYTKLAGVMALSDTNQLSGGFSCAAGFQNYIKQWCLRNSSYTHIEEDQNLVDNFRKIFMRKGSLLIFSRELPHNIYSNDTQNFRYAQYLRMSPLSALCLTPELMEARKELVKRILPKKLNVSDAISKQIFMLDETQTANQDKIQTSNPQLSSVGQKEKASRKYNCRIY